ncbi:FMN-binding protein [Intrasporangium chromatireducens Q5-1]|uniref:FMN-binding protein n=1 Tax=Intrasporangium chromatireducens Q5-1 TaxID=584657 RepID=W9GLY0_9MICO|nr:FMN-binding protein [Intrasporangium chromatireducens]EWT07085.1 FMN-binding protein [Intrasporangium chromatireducens Q5-1]
MRRIVYWAMSTLTVLVLLLSYPTSRNATAVSAESRRLAVPTVPASGGSSPSAAGTSDGASSGSTGGSPGGATGTRTVTGDAIMTRYGNVQVQITVTNGKITAADVTQIPWQDRHDQVINSQAVPIYNDEAVQSQSAQIDVVSGATYTWDGYTQSLQSAIDKANL